jgi:hypothetical protein
MKNNIYYRDLYKRFIDSRVNRDIEEGGYYELHHIKPRVMGGTNDKSNLVYLTLKEHYFAHLILVYAYPNVKRLKNGLCAMIGMMKHKGGSSRQFEIARKSATYKMPPKKELEKKYFEENQSMKLMGEFYNVSDMTICKWFKIYGIKARTPVECMMTKRIEIPDRDEFEREYREAVKNHTFKQLSKKYKVSTSQINKWLDILCIERRPREYKRPSREELKSIYAEYGIIKGAHKLNIARGTFRRWLKDDNLWVRYRARGDALTTADPIPKRG